MSALGQPLVALRVADLRAETLRLPSLGPNADDVHHLHADIDAVTVVLSNVEDDVVLVGHSGGGMLLTDLSDHSTVAAACTSPLSCHRGVSPSAIYLG